MTIPSPIPLLNLASVATELEAAQQLSSQNFAALALLWSVLGLIVLALVWPRGAGRRVVRQIFAVAILGFREGLRLKLLWTVALIAFIPGILAYFSDADGTHAGRAKVILNVCLTCGEVLGAALIVMAAALSVSREIESRIMHTLGTKPVPRWAILLGKALGFWSLDVLFLLGLVIFSAGLVRLVPLRAETRVPSELASSGTWEDLQRNALVTRQMLRAQNASPKSELTFIKPEKSLTRQFEISESCTADPLALKFLLSSSRRSQGAIHDLTLRVNYKDAAPIYEKICTVPQDRPFEIFIPQDALKTGLLQVTLTAGPSEDESYSVITSLASGIQIGLVYDHFLVCLLKAFVLMALQGWILALILTGWSGMLSFSVAVAMGFILLLSGELSQQAIELMKRPPVVSGAAEGRGANDETKSELSEQITQIMIQTLGLLPDFQINGGPAAFVEGTRTSALAIASAVFWMGLVRAIGWALPGVLLFQRREVGT